MANEIVALDQRAVRAEIERQITQVAAGTYSMTHDHKLISTIEGVTDNEIKGQLLNKYLDALTQHQGEKNSALRNDILSRIRINEQYANNEIAKESLSAILCVRHNMSARRSMYANQDEQEETGRGATQHPQRTH